MAPTSVFRAGATALITGGASGVGLAVAKLCASASMNLILVDNNTSKLDEAKSTLSQASKSSISTHSLDVSSSDAWSSLAASLEKTSTTLDFLHLNAGIGGPKKEDQTWTSASYFRSVFETNFFGVVNGLNAFYPQFTSSSASAPKAIVITGSKQGITNPPGNPAYNASKAALKSLAEQLDYSLSAEAPNSRVHLLVPGWTFTGLTGGGGMKEKPEGAWWPEQVAEYMQSKMAEGKFYIICPDNDVDWETDRKRMMWGQGDIAYERRPLSRWREDSQEEAKRGVEEMRL